MRKFSLIAWLWVCILPLQMVAQQHQLFFNEGQFKVCQFTDIHWKEGSDKSTQTVAIIQNILKAEQPNLAVLTGDIITSHPAIAGWKSIIHLFEVAQMPFTVTMGNHDAEFTTRDSIYNLLLSSPFYVGQKGPKDIQGYGNCVLPIYGSTNRGQVSAALYCIDTNDYLPVTDYGYYDWVHFNQIDWYRKQSANLTKHNNGNVLPALAFLHIPLMEYKEVIGAGTTFGNKSEGVASSDVNSGLFASFIDLKDVLAVFAGHDHGNDFIGINKGIALAYGRTSGADAGSSLERGARTIVLYEGERKFDTWISTLQGADDFYYYPSGLSSKDEKEMPYLPAKELKTKKQGVAYTYYEGQCKHTSQIAGSKKIKEGVMTNFSIKEAAVKDYFSYDFRTVINIPEKGVYRFYTYSDDGSKLFVDGQLVVDNDGGHSARHAEGKIALEKGFHELQVLYFENYMGEELQVGFSSRNILKTMLPSEILFLPQ